MKDVDKNLPAPTIPEAAIGYFLAVARASLSNSRPFFSAFLLYNIKLQSEIDMREIAAGIKLTCSFTSFFNSSLFFSTFSAKVLAFFSNLSNSSPAFSFKALPCSLAEVDLEEEGTGEGFLTSPATFLVSTLAVSNRLER